MSETDHIMSMSLEGAASFHLGRKGIAGILPTLTIRMRDKLNAATVDIPGLLPSSKSCNLMLAIRGGLFALFDIGTNQEVQLPQEKMETMKMFMRAGAPTKIISLHLDPLDDFWFQNLKPGHKYEVRWQDTVDNAESISVCYRSKPIKLDVLGKSVTLPLFTLSLSPTSTVCNLGSIPRFGLRIEITSHAKDIITVCFDKTALGEYRGLEDIIDITDENGDEVQMPWGIGCWGFDEPFPSETMFEEFVPGIPYERIFWLDEFDAETANDGELNFLEPDRRYKIECSRGLRGAFSIWRLGKKEELLIGDLEEKKKRWSGPSRKIMLDVSEAFMFETV